MRNNTSRLLFVLLIVALLVSTSEAFTQPIVEWDPSLEEFDVNAADGLRNVYVITSSFLVVSENQSYEIGIGVSPDATWNRAELDSGRHNYASAFDIAVTNHEGEWQEFRSGDEDTIHLHRQPPTSSEGRSHRIAIAFVLVEDVAVHLEGFIHRDTSGDPGTRRFGELPSGNYHTRLTISARPEVI